MKSVINKDDLFSDEYRALILCEYKKEIALIKQMISLANATVKKKECSNTFSYEGICYRFAQSIVEYNKMAYDNMILGHFYATHMIFRTIVENNVCLDIIQRYKYQELWKYYLVQSYRDSLKSFGEELKESEQDFLNKVYQNFDIEEDFFLKTKKKEGQRAFAYIDRDYGWTYKVNNTFNFSGICKLVDNGEYKDFKLMSMYSHGTSIHLKTSGFASMDHMMNTLSFFFYSMNRIAELYCYDAIDPAFHEANDKLEALLMKYVDVSPFK